MEYILKNREVISFTAAAHSVIRVKEGVLWLTSAGDSRDYFLQFGDKFEMNSQGLVVMEALTDCIFGIQHRDSASWLITGRMMQINNKQFARFDR